MLIKWNLKIKFFIRSDIFKKLNFDELGYEKVANRKIDLQWSDEDIREFIAKRIAFNLFKILDIDSLNIDINNELLYLDENSYSVPPEEEDEEENDFLNKMVRFVARKIRRDSYAARKINFIDKVNRELITSIFPREILHKDIKGQDSNMSIFEYFSSHFNMSSGKTTPRIILMFLGKTIDRVRGYYYQNPDITVELENNEYPLIKRPLLAAAYYDLQNDMWDTVSKVSKTWEIWINILRSKKKQSGMKYSFMQATFKADEQIELNQFLAFMTHLGVLICKNPELPHHERLYTLPILFKKSFKPN